ASVTTTSAKISNNRICSRGCATVPATAVSIVLTLTSGWLGSISARAARTDAVTAAGSPVVRATRATFRYIPVSTGSGNCAYGTKNSDFDPDSNDCLTSPTMPTTSIV